MANYRITCINRASHDHKYHSIKFFGGVTEDGTPWRESLDVLIIFMKYNPEHVFYVEFNGSVSKAYIVPATGDTREHIRTATNGIDDDSLLTLCECENGDLKVKCD
ncbi:MAG: hypothetical protein ACSHWN_12335 [Methylophilaceae bacterium]